MAVIPVPPCRTAQGTMLTQFLTKRRISMPAANVSAAWIPDGQIYGYICGEGCLWRYHANGTGNGKKSKLRTSHASPDSDRPVQVVAGPDKNGNLVRHVFYRQSRGENIWHAIDTSARKHRLWEQVDRDRRIASRTMWRSGRPS